MPGEFSDRINLIKAPVSALAGTAALLGFAACAPGRAAAVSAGLSVFLLSGGACALNNWQDRELDGGMERTRQRPLPARRLSPGQALLQAGLLLAAGTAGLLLCSASPLAPLAGLGAVLLYNGLYTRLKKKTLLALVPGVLCGTFPPLVGWLAAGGGLTSPRIMYLLLLFGAWQLPHVWLLALANRGDEQGMRLPSFLDRLTAPQVQRLVVTWTAAFAFLTLLLKVFRFISAPVPLALLALNAFALPLVFALALRGPLDAAGTRRLSRYLAGSLFGATLLAAAAALSR